MFSGIVKIADIDDYITPSQNCIKPISEAPTNKETQNTKQGKKKLTITSTSEEKINLSTSDDANFFQPEFSQIRQSEAKKAKITLNDCLACSGCVTTAETLLIQAQSIDEFIKNSKKSKVSICLISPQSISSLAHFFDLPEENIMEKLCFVLEEIGFNFVFNYNTILNFSLKKNFEEFKEKILKGTQNYLINSECPGWVCYAEKKIGDWIIPNLSNVKSPQQIFGNFMKNFFGQFFEFEEIFVSSIMPCFDKKLEATRGENSLKNKNEEILEVDTVISTLELLDLFEKLKIDFGKFEPKNGQRIFYSFDKFFNFFENFEEKFTDKEIFNKFLIKKSEENKEKFDLGIKNVFKSDTNFSSNGYIEFIIESLIQEEKLKNPEIKFEINRKTLKNSDYRDIELKFFDDKINEEKVFKFALIYGFRNIQNLIRNKNKIKYQYMEVMACPGGCINGGNFFII